MRTLIGVGVAALLLAASGCRRPDAATDLQLTCDVSPRPYRQGPAVVDIALIGSDGAPVAGAKVRVEGNMSHPGMTPVFGDAVEKAPGRYQATIPLTMGGDWFLDIHATLPDGRSLRRQTPLPGVRSAP